MIKITEILSLDCAFICLETTAKAMSFLTRANKCMNKSDCAPAPIVKQCFEFIPA